MPWGLVISYFYSHFFEIRTMSMVFLSENSDYGDFSQNNENFTKKLCFSNFFCAHF
jgi:hypothetical protein